MAYPERLVESYQEVVQSVKNFHMANHIALLSQFKHWYYIDELEKFAPSKFIGYKEMTDSDYEFYADWESRYDNDEPFLDGRETQKVFKKQGWFEATGNTELRTKLEEELHVYGKKLNKRATIYVRR